MKKLVTFRLDPELLAEVKRSAEADNRTVTNFVETALKRFIQTPGLKPKPAPSSCTGDQA